MKYAGETAVKDVSFMIGQGEILCIAGESGSGKSSILRAILGLSEGTDMEVAGELFFNAGAGVRSFRRGLPGREIGFVPQNPGASFNPIRPYEKQFREALKSHGHIFDRPGVCRALGTFGLEDPERILRSCPYEMSGGMNQRIAIAMAMLLGPRLLLCDEATSALDVRLQKQVVDALLRLREETGISILFVTHNLGVAARLADRVGIMHKGSLVELGKKEEVLYRPKKSHTKKLLSDIPRFVEPGCSDFEGSAPSSLPILSVSHGVKSYKKGGHTKRVLEDIHLELHPGEILGIVGESGSGKSTLLRQIACLEHLDSGKIIFNGKDITKASPRQIQARMQMVFQDAFSSFDPRMTFGESLHETVHHFDLISGRAGRGRPFDRLLGKRCCPHDYGEGPDVRTRIEELLSDVDLDPSLLARYPHQVSGGQCQRMAIARALCARPSLLLCDEATGSLDVRSQRQIVSLLRQTGKKYGLSIVFVSHDLALVSSLCHRIAVMEKGTCIETGAAQEVVHSPRMPYTKELLASVLCL